MEDKGSTLPLKLDFELISVINPRICLLLNGTVTDWLTKIDFIYFFGTIYVKVLNNDIGSETSTYIITKYYLAAETFTLIFVSKS